VNPPCQTPVVEVDLERPVGAGRVLGHDADGRVIMAEGGLPGERAMVELHEDRPRLGVGSVVELIRRSPHRVEPPCAAVAAGCGGCDLQHVAPAAQREMKVEVIRDALTHLAGLHDVEVDPGPELPAEGYRTTLRLAVADADGAVGFRLRRSHEVLAVHECLVADPVLSDLLGRIRFPGAREVVLRTSKATGETLAVVDPTAGSAEVPAGVRVVGADELRRGERVWMHEDVLGHRLRVSARSFFQSGPTGAAALATAVADAFGGAPAVQGGRLVDLYGGIGLFGVTLGARGGELVERSASAVADARVNTASLGTRVQRVSVQHWRASRADFVVADPPRDGLGKTGVDAVVDTEAPKVALVSCDPAAMGRDVALLRERGLEVVSVRLVDQFVHTHHVEAVVALKRP
jgi:23S rRNA (uracil1939-C5)-methyltransferase